MKTVQTILRQLTNPTIIMQELCEIMRHVDPEFLIVENKFLAAVSNLERELEDSITPSISEFISAKEMTLAAEVIFIGWQGFQLNIDIFKAPINRVMLQGDFEELHRESCLAMLPMVYKSKNTITAFYDAIRERHKEIIDQVDDITNYYSYLQTVGFKIVHYFGFCLADGFLPYIIPGYISNQVDTLSYKNNLKKLLKVDLDYLEKWRDADKKE